MNNTIDNTCGTLLDVNIQPYWLIIANTLILWFLNCAFKTVYDLCKTKCSTEKKVQSESESESDPELQNEYKNQIIEERIKTRTIQLFELDYYLVIIQTIFHLIHFCYIIYHTNTHKTIWDQYQVLYTRFFNSGVVVFWLNGYFSKGTKTNTAADDVAGYCFLILTAVGLPGFLTHTLPMSFAYCWILWITGLFGYCSIYLFRKYEEREYFGIVVLIIFRTIVLLFGIIWIQSAFNYGILSYSSDIQYTQIPITEFQLRNTHCYFEDILTVSERIVSLISTLL